MASKTGQQAVPAMNLRRTFENAVRDIHQAGLSGKTPRYRSPIVQKSIDAPAVASANVQKQAISDAVNALAQLWNIAPNSSR